MLGEGGGFGGPDRITVIWFFFGSKMRNNGHFRLPAYALKRKSFKKRAPSKFSNRKIVHYFDPKYGPSVKRLLTSLVTHLLMTEFAQSWFSTFVIYRVKKEYPADPNENIIKQMINPQ